MIEGLLHPVESFRKDPGVECGGELLVGPDARVNANVRAMHVTISGLVAGNLVARGAKHVLLLGRSAPSADVEAKLAALRQGGARVDTARVDIRDVAFVSFTLDHRPY